MSAIRSSSSRVLRAFQRPVALTQSSYRPYSSSGDTIGGSKQLYLIFPFLHFHTFTRHPSNLFQNTILQRLTSYLTRILLLYLSN